MRCRSSICPGRRVPSLGVLSFCTWLCVFCFHYVNYCTLRKGSEKGSFRVDFAKGSWSCGNKLTTCRAKGRVVLGDTTRGVGWNSMPEKVCKNVEIRAFCKVELAFVTSRFLKCEV